VTNSQLLAQARAFNPEIGSIHVEHTVYADGDEFLHYIAHVPGDQIFGDSPDDLLANVMASSRKAAA
jgi:hypothetical protein